MTAAEPRGVGLAEFLLARIAEDEAVARRCAEAYPPPWDVNDRGHTATIRADEPNFWPVTVLEQSDSLDGWLGEYVEHIARHDPARVLAECAAKRRIVELVAAFQEGTVSADAATYLTVNALASGTLRALASVYAGHEQFREEWRA